MYINMILLTALVAFAFLTVMTRSLLRSALGLAATSAVLAIVMYRLNSPLAAVFELSVCAGLISALFFCTISITHPLTPQKTQEYMRIRIARYWYLPVIMVIAIIVLSFMTIKMDLKLPVPVTDIDVRQVLWQTRQLDIVGQIIILLSGVFGIVILLKEVTKKNG